MQVRRLLVGLFLVAVLLALAGIALAATTLTYGGTLDGETHPWDDYVFYFEAGTTVTVAEDCIPNDSSNPLDPEVDVYGPGGFYANNDDSGLPHCVQASSALLTFVAPTTGNYTIRASSYEIISDDDPTDINADGSYRLTLTINGGFGIISLRGVPYLGEYWDPGDGRLNPHPAAPLAIYCGTDSIYAYLPGFLEFDFPLDEVGATPAVNTLLAEGVSGSRLYHLSTGEFQVNMRHGNEEYVFIWDGCPAGIMTTRVYNATTWELLSEYTR